MGKKKFFQALADKKTPKKKEKKQKTHIELKKKEKIQEKMIIHTYININDEDGRYIYIYEIGDRKILVMDP